MVDTVFCDLDVPVTEFIPQEVVYLGKCDTELKLVHIFCYVFYKVVTLGHDPSVSRTDSKISRLFQFFIAQIHHNKSGSIPYFICKVTACFYTFIIETHIITRCITCH